MMNPFLKQSEGKAGGTEHVGQQPSSSTANRAPSSLSNGARSTASSSRVDSGTDSPQSSHSSINELGASHESMPSGGGSADSLKMSASSNGAAPLDLNLNMTASQMRQIIAQRKKKDAKKANIDLREKYEIIQQM